MGAKRITKERYDEIKKHLKVPADDAGVMAKFDIGKTTTRYIRNTKDYQEYCEKVFRFHGNPRKRGHNDSKASGQQRAVTEKRVEPEPLTIGFELYEPTERKLDSFEAMEGEMKSLRAYLFTMVFLPFFVTAVVIVLGLIALVKAIFGGGA